MEDNFWWKTTLDERQFLMEDNLWWKTTFDGSQTSIQDELWREKTGRLPKLEFDMSCLSCIPRAISWYCCCCCLQLFCNVVLLRLKIIVEKLLSQENTGRDKDSSCLNWDKQITRTWNDCSRILVKGQLAIDSTCVCLTIATSSSLQDEAKLNLYPRVWHS